MAKNRVHKGDFSKLSTGEFPVFTGPVELVKPVRPDRFQLCLDAQIEHARL
jgi:hypothetical protein